jgi:hypothetical protein
MVFRVSFRELLDSAQTFGMSFSKPNSTRPRIFQPKGEFLPRAAQREQARPTAKNQIELWAKIPFLNQIARNERACGAHAHALLLNLLRAFKSF